jgi:quinol monooxygenase YgiN
MATFLAHIRVNPGCEAQFEAVAATLWRSTHATETAVRRYEYWRGAEPGTYYTLGSFDGYAGFIAHQVSDHHMGASAPLRDLIADIRLEWVDPLRDASGLTPTEMIAPPDDADALTLRYFGRQPAEVADWWPRPVN